ncbi:hypothetical protein [Streptomyces sp. NPDC051218]|uniref:hypothetical protein n=1 Tax=Streptomyces sp. NPDC051218 TaxID=3365645 RepID=UPI0037ADFD53
MVTELSVEEFLNLPFPSLSEGGYAGLVFLVSRTADAPKLQERFLREWSDIHDVTAHYLGVVIPHPRGAMPLGGAGNYEAVLVRGVERLSNPDKRHSWYPEGQVPLRQGSGDHVRVHTRAAPSLPRNRRIHGRQLTLAVNELQTFFGISEVLLPCAVVICRQEQRVIAVTLDNDGSVYRLLKEVKSQLEGHLSDLRQYAAAVEEVKRELRAHGEHVDAVHRDCAAARRAWETERDEVIAVLARIGGTRTDRDGRLCSWMSRQLASEEPLADDDQAAVQEVLRLFESPNVAFLRLPHRIPRVLEQRERFLEAKHRLVAAEEHSRSIMDRKDHLTAQYAAAANASALAAAVTSAGEALGLEPAGPQHGLLSWRRIGWPISVLKLPEQKSPTFGVVRG